MAQTNYIPLRVFAGAKPTDTPRVLPITVDLTSGNPVSIDMQQPVSLGQVSMVQSLYVDNSANAVPVTVHQLYTQQRITVPARQQGAIPILTGETPRFLFTVPSAATGLFYFFPLNVPLDAEFWSVSSGTSSFAPNGNLLVADTVLRSAVSSGRFNKLNYGYMTNSQAVPMMWGNNSARVTTTGTTLVNLFSGSPGWILSGYNLTVTGSATRATSMDLAVDILEDTTVLFTHYGFAGPIATGQMQTLAVLSNLSITSKTANSNFAWRRTTGITTGLYVLTYNTALTNFVG